MKKKKIILAVVAVAIIAAVLFVFLRPKVPEQTLVRTAYINSGELSSTVNVTGTVYSQSAAEVHSKLTYTVNEIFVEVGDTVQAGDVLAQLDTSSLELDIAQARAALNSSQALALQKVEDAQRELETHRFNAQNDYNTALLTAEQVLEQAELEVQAASNALFAARQENRNSRRGDDDLSDQDRDDLRNTITQREIALEKAQANLEAAKRDLEAVKNGTRNTEADYEAAVESARLGTDFTDQAIAIQKMQADLADATVTAPISGVVTAVVAVEGASANGLMFVIQDTENLRVVANIKEYDIHRISIGDTVEIKSDATGGNIYEGVLHKIAPTSTLSAKNEKDDATDAEFESEVLVRSEGDLRIGMNARMNIITAKKENALYVSTYEALLEDMDGTYVHVLRGDNESGYYAKAVRVDVGLETDFYSEIISSELTEDDIIIMENFGIEDGMEVFPAPGQPVPDEGALEAGEEDA